MSRVVLGSLEVRWVGGGLALLHPEGGLLIDAPAGVVAELGVDLPRIQAVLLTGDRTRSLTGLLPLLAALDRHRLRDLPLEVRFPLGAERGAMLTETWVRGWPDAYPVTLDGEAAGGVVDIGPFTVHSRSLRTGEPRWRTGEVASVVGTGVRVEVDGVSVAWVPGAGPERSVDRLCDGVDLAVVEVGVEPWPRSERVWRLGMSEAMERASGARQVWLPGDDGRLERSES